MIKNTLHGVLTILCALVPGLSYAVPGYNMPIGVTPLSQEIHHLHMTVFWVVVAIGVVVFGVMFYAIIMHRKSRGVKPATFHEHPTVEIMWSIVPLIILILIAIPATKVVLNAMDMSNSEVNIKITGYQWKWKYEYLDNDISFFSNLATSQNEIHNKAHKSEWYLLDVDQPLVVPTDRKIRFLITSNDVMHAWWVPEFGIKQDAIPGYIKEVWATVQKPGIYRGQCAELCGANHGYMPIVVVAKTPDDYAAWIAQQKGQKVPENKVAGAKATHQDLMIQGEKVYQKTCLVCHQANGEGTPPAITAIKGSAIAKGPKENHIRVVVNGVKGTAMQAFGQQLSDEDIAAVITYERNAFGNNTGDEVQSAEVTAFKKQQGN